LDVYEKIWATRYIQRRQPDETVRNEEKSLLKSLSVIIATMNRSDDLKAALSSLLRQTHFPEQILIVDQSTDERSKIVVSEIQMAHPEKAARFQYVYQEEKSLVKARNRGLSIATGDILSFLDDDVVLFDNYYEQILEAWRKFPDVVAMSGSTLIRRPMAGFKWTLRRFLNHAFLVGHYDGKMTVSGCGYPITEKEIHRLLRVEMLPGCNMNFKKSAVNGEKFDEWFKGYSYREDAEFSYRISKKGRVLMIPDAKLWHNYSSVSRLSEAELKLMVIKNHYYVFRKFKGNNVLATLLFCYSLLGFVAMDLLEYLFQRTPAKWGKLKAGISASFSVFKDA
jgi:glycosyltransferase involved in cell wall biosynthesis